MTAAMSFGRFPSRPSAVFLIVCSCTAAGTAALNASVAVAPGATPLTVMFCEPRSAAKPRVSASIAPFVPAYRLEWGAGVRACPEVRLTMCPPLAPARTCELGHAKDRAAHIRLEDRVKVSRIYLVRRNIVAA